jgi:hypothetical protein
MAFGRGVTLITPTGGRPEAFALCKRFVRRQTWGGPLQWIIVNDGRTGESGDLIAWRSGFAIQMVFPEPKWQHGQNTQARNLLAAIPEVAFDKVLFFEDDDHYAATYVEEMAAKLETYQIVGETRARYYHVPSRWYYQLQNEQHASLCQTGIRSDLLPQLASACEETKLRPVGMQYIDLQLWEKPSASRWLYPSNLSVGIKGLPGREGIGCGHRPDNNWSQDSADLAILRSWIGSDVELYKEFM